MSDVWKGILGLIVLGCLVWLFVSAGIYNVSVIDLCKEHGLVMVKEWPFGSYGCGEVIPFDEVGAR